MWWAMQEPNGEKTSGIRDHMTAHLHAITGVGSDSDSMWECLRCVTFLGVLKAVVSQGHGEDAQDARCASCCAQVICDGHVLSGIPLRDLASGELLAVVNFLRASHHNLEWTAATAHFLRGLLYRCAAVTIHVAQLASPSVSLHVMARTLDNGRHASEALLCGCEMLFAGIARDTGSVQRFFTAGQDAAPFPAPPTVTTENLPWIGAVRALRALVVLQAGDKAMQRVCIQERESLLTGILCPYGKEAKRRRELTSTGRTQLVLQFDRLSYRTVVDLVNTDGELHDDPSCCLMCRQAALWASVATVLERLGETVQAWLRERVSWLAWEGPANTLRLERNFGSLCDTEGYFHNTILSFLGRVIHCQRSAIPAVLRRELESAADA